jgi:hypothetical protein
MWMSDNELHINPPCWDSALFFLDRFTYLDTEFSVVDLVTTGMFDLSHPETAEQLDLTKALRAIRQKSSIAKSIVKWMAENKDCPEAEALVCDSSEAIETLMLNQVIPFFKDDFDSVVGD